MNKFKTAIIALLCSIFVLGLTSCDKKESSKSSSSVLESSSSSIVESSSNKSVESSSSEASSTKSSESSSSVFVQTKFNLTFNTQGASENKTEVYEAGSSVTLPTAPVKSGWTFSGWYLDRYFNEEFSGSMPDSDTVLYAKWTNEDRLVTSFMNASIPDVATVYGETLTLPSNPVREGYVFSGWYSDKELTTVYDTASTVLASQVLYASWDKTDNNLYVNLKALNGNSNETFELFYDKDESFSLEDDFFGSANTFTLYKDASLTEVYSGGALDNDVTLYADVETKGLEYNGNTVTSYMADLMDPASTVYVPFKHNGVVVSEIGAEAFYNVDSMEVIKLTSNITTIGDRAFAYSSYLVEAILPSNLTSLGVHAFDSTIRLERIGSLGKLTSVPAYAFMGDLALENFTVSDTVTTVSEYAFTNNRNLTEFSLSNVVSVSKYAFSNTGLLNVDINADLTSIGDGAFMNVPAVFTVESENKDFKLENGLLTSADLKTLYLVTEEIEVFDLSSFDEIKADALEGSSLNKVIVTDSLSAVNLLSGVKSVDYLVVPNLTTPIVYYFGGSKLDSNGLSGNFIPSDITTLEVSVEVSDIPDYAFYGMSNLSVIKGIKLVNVGDFAFSGTAIKTLELDKDLTEFNTSSVDHLLLDSITAPDNSVYTVLEDGALVSLDKTKLVYVPSSFISYLIPSSISIINENAFTYSGVESIVVPNTIDKLIVGAFQNMRGLKEYTAPFIGDNSTDQTMYSPFGGHIATTGDITGNKVPSSIGKVTISGNITSVAANAFLLCEGILEINLPDSVKSIGDYGLALTGISSIVLPKECVSLGSNAFAMNFNLLKVTTNEKLRNLGTTVFARNPFLEEVVFAEGLESIPANTFDVYTENTISGDDSSPQLYLSKINKVVLPSTLKSIGNNAFAYAGLWDADLDETFQVDIRDVSNSKLESIGESAFANSAITYMVLPNTLKSIGEKAFDNALNLYEVEIGFDGLSSLSSIGANAFNNTDLRRLTINKEASDSMTNITVLEDAFRNCDRLVLYVPESSVDAFSSDLGFSDLRVEAIK